MTTIDWFDTTEESPEAVAVPSRRTTTTPAAGPTDCALCRSVGVSSPAGVLLAAIGGYLCSVHPSAFIAVAYGTYLATRPRCAEHHINGAGLLEQVRTHVSERRAARVAVRDHVKVTAPEVTAPEIVTPKAGRSTVSRPATTTSSLAPDDLSFFTDTAELDEDIAVIGTTPTTSPDTSTSDDAPRRRKERSSIIAQVKADIARSRARARRVRLAGGSTGARARSYRRGLGTTGNMLVRIGIAIAIVAAVFALLPKLTGTAATNNATKPADGAALLAAVTADARAHHGQNGTFTGFPYPDDVLVASGRNALVLATNVGGVCHYASLLPGKDFVLGRDDTALRCVPEQIARAQASIDKSGA
jgi:hypothetical protein